jgi:hypothetical protein
VHLGGIDVAVDQKRAIRRHRSGIGAPIDDVGNAAQSFAVAAYLRTYGDRIVDARTRSQKQTKSKSGQRRIEIDVATMGHLEAHRERMRLEGIPTGPRDLVFQNQAGKAVSASNLVDREFRPIAEAAGISDEFRFHDLRHFHATLLLSGGMNPKVVQERLGHESVKTTLDLYGHVLPTAQRDAATLVGNVLFSGKSLTSSLTVVREQRHSKPVGKKKVLTA